MIDNKASDGLQDAWHPEDVREDLRGGDARRAYVRPRLIVIASADELLDALGPAQAGYGGSGIP